MPSGTPSKMVVTFNPAVASMRAVIIMPSPPLLPRPQSTVDPPLSLREALARERGDSRRRGAHQFEGGNTKALGGRTIARLHFGSRKNLHQHLWYSGYRRCSAVQ